MKRVVIVIAVVVVEMVVVVVLVVVVVGIKGPHSLTHTPSLTPTLTQSTRLIFLAGGP